MDTTNLWFGSEASLEPYIRYLDYMADQSPEALMFQGSDEDDDETDMPEIAQVEGSVGIISMNGSLIPNSNWLTRMFGMTGYDDISKAAQYMLEDPDVKSIVLSVNSGGGAVMGLEAASEILKLVAKEKPVYSNAEGGMLSAAYFLGSIGKQISGTSMAQFGSIGTLITHVSVARALKESGRDVTLIRSGKYKALGHPAEKLSKEAKAKLQGEADMLTGFFRQHVEGQRGKSLGTWNSWGEGQVFFSDEAIKVGLSDRMGNLSQLVTRLNRKSETMETPGMKKKIVLQDEQAAAQLESGVPLKDVGHEEVTDTSKATEEGGATASADGGTTTTEEGTTEATASDEGTEKGAGDTAPDTTGVVAFLKEQNSGLNSKVITVETELASVKAELAEVQSQVPSLIGVAVQAIQKMQVGMGQTPTAGLEKLPASTVMEQYAAVQKQFHDTFPVGQKSTDTPTEDSPQATVTPLNLGIMPKAHTK